MPLPDPRHIKAIPQVASEQIHAELTLHLTPGEDAIEELHAWFGEWLEHPAFALLKEHDVFYRLQLSLHEWIANLVQHACFGVAEPAISIYVRFLNPLKVQCVVADNSIGFDFDHHIEQERDRRNEEFFQERGLGLLILETSVSNLNYICSEQGINFLTFEISIHDTSCLNFPF